MATKQKHRKRCPPPYLPCLPHIDIALRHACIINVSLATHNRKPMIGTVSPPLIVSSIISIWTY